MAQIPHLNCTASLITARALMGHYDKADERIKAYLIGLLKTEAFSAVSLDVLKLILRDHSSELSNDVLVSLAPPHLKEISLSGCTKLSLSGINGLVRKCHKLRNLDLTGCNYLMSPSLFHYFGRTTPCLTSLTLNDCSTVTNEIVKVILLTLTMLKHLGLSMCKRLTDAAFLLVYPNTTDKSKTQQVNLNGQPLCHLTSIDISGCPRLTSAAIRHLSTLCGPTLESVNIAFTRIDCTALLFLAGYSLLHDDSRCVHHDSVGEQILFALQHKQNDVDQCLPSADAYHQSNVTDVKKVNDVRQTDLLKDVDDTHNLAVNAVDDSCLVDVDQIYFLPCQSTDEEKEDEREKTKNEVFNMTILHQAEQEMPSSSLAAAEAEALGSDGCFSLTIDPTESRNSIMLPRKDAFTKEVLEKSVTELSGDLDRCSSKKCVTQDHSDKTLSSDHVSYLPELLTTDLCISSNETLLHFVSEHQSNELIASSNCDSEKEIENDSSEKLVEKEIIDVKNQRPSSSSCDFDSSKINDVHPTNHEFCFSDFSELVSRNVKLFSDFSSDHFNLESSCCSLVQTFSPKLTSLDITGIPFSSPEIGTLCLSLLACKSHLVKLIVSWNMLSDYVLMKFADNGENLHHLSLVECHNVTSTGLSYVGLKCNNIQLLNLQGVTFIDDDALLPIISNKNLVSVNVAECYITDITLSYLAKHCSEKLKNLNVSWCDELTNEGLESIVQHCSELETLCIRQSDATVKTLQLISVNCSNLKYLDLSSVTCYDDQLLVVMSSCLKFLEKLDISWNAALTDVSVSAVLRSCIFLSELLASGLRELSTAPFLPIISDLRKWRRCQALLRVKLYEKKLFEETGESQFSSDEEFEEIYLPHRSTCYAPALRFISLEYCDGLNDSHLSEIVAICRGTLKVQDYYGQNLEPAWIKCQKGRAYLAPQ